MFWLLFPGLGMLRSGMSWLFACTCLIIAYKWLASKCTCFNKADIRHIWGVGKLFMKLGIDKYETFQIVVQVHCVKDLPKGSVFGQCKYFVTCGAKYEVVKTRVSPTGKWEQTIKLTVPQGTDEIIVTLYESKLIGSASEIGSVSFSVESAIMKNPDAFFNKKKYHRLSKEDAAGSCGQLMVTFRRGNEGPMEEEVPFIKEFDPDNQPALYGCLLEVVAEMEPKPANLEGQDKLELIAKAMKGKLSSDKLKKEDPVFHAVIFMDTRTSSDESDGKSAATEALNPDAHKRWVLAWFFDGVRKFEKHPDKPDGYISLLSISSIHNIPDKQGDFIMRYYKGEGGKKVKVENRFTCADKDAEAWTAGLDIMREECRAMKAFRKKRMEHWKKLTPADRLEEWMSHYRKMGYSDEELKKYYQDFRLSQMPEAERKQFLDAQTKNEFIKPLIDQVKAQGQAKK